jgi:DNA-binding CsgD family transcriptional regulator
MPEQHEQPIARQIELGLVDEFLGDVVSGLTGIFLEGRAGSGKTTLWRAGLARAGERGYRVLSSRPSAAEASLSFSVLGDLFREVVLEGADTLPSPQRRSLEVALMLEDPEGPGPNALAVSLAVQGILRSLVESGPVVVAIDDIDWVDHPSGQALEFALRRSEPLPLGVLATGTRSPGHQLAPPLDGIAAARLRRAELGSLGREDLGRVLQSALGVRHPAHVLARLHTASGGNPLYAIEIARALDRRGIDLALDAPVPVPDSLAAALRERIAVLAPSTREVLLYVAMLAEPGRAALERALGSAEEVSRALGEAERSGLLDRDDRTTRLAHPLLGTVLYADTPASERPALHRRVAQATDDEEERARHLALASEGPDREVARRLDEAAAGARSRGAPEAAAELLEQATRLTPPADHGERHRRSVLAAECHLDAGNTARSRALLEQVLDEVEAGPTRAQALQRLGWVRYHEDSWTAAAHLFGEAREVADDDPSFAVAVALDSSMASVFAGDLAGAEEQARRALELARQAGDSALLAEAIAMGGSVGFLMGRGIPEEDMEEALTMESWERSRPTPIHPSVAFGLMLKWSDDLARARARLRSAYDRAREEGNERSLPFLLFHLAELECWAGDWGLASTYADEGCAVATQTGHESSLAFVLYARALVQAHRGNIGPAREDAERGLGLAERSGAVPARALLLSALGFIELSLGDHSAAHRYLGPLADAALQAGVREPGVVRFAGDALENLISLGDLERAESLLVPLEERSGELGRVWGMAISARGRGLLCAARGDVSEALEELDRALEHHRRLRQPFELGRTLLVRGGAQRRVLQRRAARESLEEASEIFQRLGAALWAEKARSEAARIGGRAPSSVALTPTEERVARLVAEGRTNREVAEALFLAVRTVEWNVARIYRKLGVRSRTELARWVLAGGVQDPPPS